MSLKTCNKERMQALYWLIKLYWNETRGGGFDIEEVGKFLSDRKLNPIYQEFDSNIKELIEEVERLT